MFSEVNSQQFSVQSTHNWANYWLDTRLSGLEKFHKSSNSSLSLGDDRSILPVTAVDVGWSERKGEAQLTAHISVEQGNTPLLSITGPSLQGWGVGATTTTTASQPALPAALRRNNPSHQPAVCQSASDFVLIISSAQCWVCVWARLNFSFIIRFYDKQFEQWSWW